jgi:hypothetical protein
MSRRASHKLVKTCIRLFVFFSIISIKPANHYQLYLTFVSAFLGYLCGFIMYEPSSQHLIPEEDKEMQQQQKESIKLKLKRVKPSMPDPIPDINEMIKDYDKKLAYKMGIDEGEDVVNTQKINKKVRYEVTRDDKEEEDGMMVDEATKMRKKIFKKFVDEEEEDGMMVDEATKMRKKIFKKFVDEEEEEDTEDEKPNKKKSRMNQEEDDAEERKADEIYKTIKDKIISLQKEGVFKDSEIQERLEKAAKKNGVHDAYLRSLGIEVKKKKTSNQLDDDWSYPKDIVFLGSRRKQRRFNKRTTYDIGRGYKVFLTTSNSRYGPYEQVRVQYINADDTKKKFKANYPIHIIKGLRNSLTLILQELGEEEVTTT